MNALRANDITGPETDLTVDKTSGWRRKKQESELKKLFMLTAVSCIGEMAHEYCHFGFKCTSRNNQVSIYIELLALAEICIPLNATIAFKTHPIWKFSRQMDHIEARILLLKWNLPSWLEISLIHLMPFPSLSISQSPPPCPSLSTSFVLHLSIVHGTIWYTTNNHLDCRFHDFVFVFDLLQLSSHFSQNLLSRL